MENTEYEKIIKIQEQIKSLRIIINAKINLKFKKLIYTHKEILVKYILKLCVICGIYFRFKNFAEQLTQNNCQNIFSLMNLLLPYFELNHSDQIENLDFLFKNSDLQALKLESSYYLDHTIYMESENYLEEYFENTIKSIDSTFRKISTKLLPNWINVFPYTISNYMYSDVFINLNNMVLNKKFINKDSLLEYINERISLDSNTFDSLLHLGYSNLYGCIYNFLYNDIKSIKFMIFDKLENNKPIPNIIVLADSLGIHKIVNLKWEQLSLEEKNTIKYNWDKLLLNQLKFPTLRSLVLFYLRWESNIDELKKLRINRECQKILFTKLKSDEDLDNDDFDENILGVKKIPIEKIDECIRLVGSKLNVEYIYNYLFRSIQKFRYTWYGYVCLDSEHNILTTQNYLLNYSILYPEFIINTNVLISPKNIYNFFKSMINDASGGNYTLISNSFSWDSIDIQVQNKFIQRLNSIHENNTWFNINKNIARIYEKDLSLPKDKEFINKFTNQIKERMGKKGMFAKLIIETLVINNMLSYVKYNPKLSDERMIPNKNKENSKWKAYFLNKVDIESYKDSYSFLSNRRLSSYPINLTESKSLYQIIKETRWYTTFGSDWIAQIQVFHKILNQRVMFVTGATGVGKSTTFPFITLYGHKMLFFNNNTKVLCTQPRVQPAVDNSTFVSRYLGLPFEKDSSDQYIIKNINYLQIKTKKVSIIDDEYHPTLKYCTDGSFMIELKQNYLLKRINIIDGKLSKENIYNCILVDEAHEHNPNMDMILTLIRFSTYINNQILLGIVSATMEDDESTYRIYYQMIDDNWKWPLDLKYKDYSNLNYNSNMLDRRIHLSPPFLTTNFKIEEYDNAINKELLENEIINTVNTILNTTSDGDILIFQNGQAEIVKLLDLLNKKTPESVLAVPFYSKLSKNILENYVKKIHDPLVRRSIINKKTIPIDEIENLGPTDKVQPGTYQRFIIIATNIAEASITIDTLKFVIDTGEQKVNVYNPSRDMSKIEVKSIAVPNQKQRRGRVGRVKPGTVYYLYDRKSLDTRVLFKITIENITSLLLSLLTYSDTKLIDKSSDPYLVSELSSISEFLQSQYSYLNISYTPILYLNNRLPELLYENKIIYPYSDGGYDIDTLIDESGKFFIIHPNELDFTRDIKNLEIISRLSNYYNKANKIFQLSILKGYISDLTNRLSPYGELVINLMNVFISEEEEESSQDLKITTLILDLISLGYDVESELFRMIILFVIFKGSKYKFKFIDLIGNADFLIYSSMIPYFMYKIIDIDLIISKVNRENIIDYIGINVYFELNRLKESYELLRDIRYFNILKEYFIYKILLKIVINSNEYPYLYKNPVLSKINISNNIVYPPKKIKLMKLLNNYDLMCLLIIKNYPYNIYYNVIGTNFYIEYFNRDVNRVYEINNFMFKDKKIYLTSVKKDLIYNTIFSLKIDEPNLLNNLMWINNNVLLVLKFIINLNDILRINTKINKEELVLLYEKDSYKVLEKVDKILETISILTKI